MSEPFAAAPAELTRRLIGHEKLIWWDRPIAKLLARREFQYPFLFGLFFFGFSVFWMTMAWHAPGGFFLFGLPFIGFGLWTISAPWRAYRRADWTLYALTDRRALILEGSTTRSFPLELIEFVETESFADGSGHVLFFKDAPPLIRLSSNNNWTVIKSGFLAIRDADNVGRALLDEREKRRNPPRPTVVS